MRTLTFRTGISVLNFPTRTSRHSADVLIPTMGRGSRLGKD